MTNNKNYAIITIVNEREVMKMKNSQMLANLVDTLEKEQGKSPITLQLRYALCGFKGYEHYKPTKENFSEFFK